MAALDGDWRDCHRKIIQFFIQVNLNIIILRCLKINSCSPRRLRLGFRPNRGVAALVVLIRVQPHHLHCV